MNVKIITLLVLIFILFYRVTSLIKELVKLEIDSRSTIALGLAHIFSQLTVTNHELMLQALSEKELTHQQYQQLKKLSKIKTKDEKGSIIEEKEVFYLNSFSFE